MAFTAVGGHPHGDSGLGALPLRAQTTNPPGLPQDTDSNPQEISSRDVEPTFKLQSERNLVMVRVVVRDAQGGDG